MSLTNLSSLIAVPGSFGELGRWDSGVPTGLRALEGCRDQSEGDVEQDGKHDVVEV